MTPFYQIYLCKFIFYYLLGYLVPFHLSSGICPISLNIVILYDIPLYSLIQILWGVSVGKENATAIIRLLDTGQGQDAVIEIMQFSTEGRAAKQEPIIFALALCARMGIYMLFVVVCLFVCFCLHIIYIYLLLRRYRD